MNQNLQDAIGIVRELWLASANDTCVRCERHECQHSLLRAIEVHLILQKDYGIGL